MQKPIISLGFYFTMHFIYPIYSKWVTQVISKSQIFIMYKPYNTNHAKFLAKHSNYISIDSQF